LINDIEIIRQHLALQKFIIIGHSGHAFMALEYAKKYPQHIEGVVLIGVTPDYSHSTHAIADKFFAETASPERIALFTNNMSKLPAMIASEPEKRFVNYCLAAGPKSWYDYMYDASSHWRDIVSNMQVIDHVWGVVFRDIDITIDLNKFDKPVFLAIGKYDYLTGPPFLWDDIKKQFKDITIKIFERSAHSPQLEEAKLFDNYFLNWIRSVTRGN
jgi:proline iminopeptidase